MSLHKSKLKACSLTLPESVCRLALLLAPARKQRDVSCPLQMCFWLARACPGCVDHVPTDLPASTAFPTLSFLVSFTKPR